MGELPRADGDHILLARLDHDLGTPQRLVRDGRRPGQARLVAELEVSRMRRVPAVADVTLKYR